MAANKPVLFFSVSVGVAILAILAASYTAFLGARVAPGTKFRILGPDTVVAGRVHIVQWDISPRAIWQYPSEKIELCRGRLFGVRCVTLTPDTPNDGAARVAIPRNFPVGTAYLRLTARSIRGALFASRSAARPITVQPARPRAIGGSRVPPQPVPPPEPESGGGGGSGGDSGGGGGGSPPLVATASAVFLSPLAGDRPSANGSLLTQVRLRWQEGNEPSCQEWKLDGRTLTTSDWLGGQSPDLSDGPCL